MLVPVIGIVQVGAQAMADRYTYLPLVGVFLIVAFGLRDVVAPAMNRITALAGAAWLLALALATRHQVAYWRSTRTLFEHTIAVTGANSLAQQCLGNALILEGDLDGAIAHLSEALRITPEFPDTENSLGMALGSKGRYEEALAHFRSAVRQQPRSAMAQYNLGFALVSLGRTDEAIAAYEAALRIDPDQFVANQKLGIALGSKGRTAKALAHLEKALALRPEDAETRRALAVTEILEGRVEEGIAHYRELLEADPGDLDALNNIAWIRAAHAEAAHRDGREAVALAERARDRSPEENEVLFDTLAAAYAEAGRFEEAIAACDKAVALARAKGDAPAASRFEGHLELFRARRPLHAAPAGAPGSR
jgi:tetratricopeptide (TPR) repeat protein